MREKISTSIDEALKETYLQAVVTGQNWINSREDNFNNKYLIVFSNFMNDFLDLLLRNCFKVNRKP